MRSLDKILIILGLSFIALIILANLIRLVAFEDKPDPIEGAISKVLGNEHLVLGSRLKLWLSDLGNPDLIVSCEHIFKYSQFYWLKRGIGVGIEGETNGELANVSDKRIVSILIPTKVNIPVEIGDHCKIVSGNDTNLEFEELLDAELNGVRIRDVEESNIKKLYDYYDASEDFYSDMPYYFAKVSVRLTRYKDPDCQRNCRDEDEIHIIKIGDSDIISISKVPRFLKRLTAIPSIIVEIIRAVSDVQNPD